MQQAKRPLNENGEDCMLGKLCRLSRVCGQRLSSPDLYSQQRRLGPRGTAAAIAYLVKLTSLLVAGRVVRQKDNTTLMATLDRGNIRLPARSVVLTAEGRMARFRRATHWLR